MKRNHLFLLAAFLLLSHFGFTQWSPINIAAGKYALTFNFLSDDIGYALMLETPSGAQTLEKTTDGGITWIQLNRPLGSEFQDFHFFANGQGVALLRDLQNPTQPTKIYMTGTDGMSWQDISPDTTAIGIGNAQCQFISADTGFFATDVKFYATEDGGASWRSTTIGRYTTSLHFLDGKNGLLGTFDGTFSYFGSILTTSDGGMTWDSLNLNETQSVIGVVEQLTPTTAYAAPAKWGGDRKSKYFKTTNNGTSWDTLYVPTTFADAYIKEIDFRDLQNGALILGSFTGNYIYHTIDGGQNWIFQDSIPYFQIEDLEMTANTGYIGGEFGKIYKLSGPLAVQEKVEDAFHIYPNPVAIGQTLKWDAAQKFEQLQLIDISGKMVYKATLFQNELVVPELPRGIYFARFQGKTSTQSYKLMVQ